jgi:hypothetical protein
MGGHLVTHEFLYIPECPVALMGRDLLSKLQAQISFQEEGEAALSFGSVTPRVLALITPREEEWKLHSDETALKGPKMPFEVPGIWAKDNPPGLAINIPPVVIEKARSHPSKNETIPNPDEGMKRDISSPPETLKTMKSRDLSICVEQSFAASSEARHQ